MNLRIAHVTATFPPYLGGTGNVCFQHARELARRGHDVSVMTAAEGDAPRSESIGGINVTRLPSTLRYGNARLLPGLARRLHGFDVIHLHYPFVGGEIAALTALFRRIPLVITYHQDVLLEGPMRLVELMLRQSAGRLALRCARFILFTTLDYGRSSYVNSMLRHRQRQIQELPNGVDTTYFSLPSSRIFERERLNLGPNQKVVLMVASLDRAHYFKGVNVLLEAMTRVPDDVTAVIIGDGDLRDSYEHAATAAGLRSRVRFAGRVSSDDLRCYYQTADVTVLPSTTMGEAFGLVLLESMSCGTPVIASNLPGVRTVISHQSDGLLVDPGDASELANAIRMLLVNDDSRQEFGLRGRRKVEQIYDWRLIGERLESVYRDAVAGRPARAVHARAGKNLGA